jgi:hypothetical protein
VIVLAESETDEPSAFNHDRWAFRLKERATLSDVSDPHVAAQLIERIGWALADAEDAQRAASSSKDRRSVTTAVVPEPGAGGADATSDGDDLLRGDPAMTSCSDPPRQRRQPVLINGDATAAFLWKRRQDAPRRRCSEREVAASSPTAVLGTCAPVYGRSRRGA